MKFQATRELVVETCRRLADQGFLAGTGGNVALRADETTLAVTPSATDYYSMSPSEVCLVGLNDPRQIAGEKRPSVELKLHSNVLLARPDCSASIHTHQPIASAYTLLASALSIKNPRHRELLGDRIPCAGYAPSGTSWLAGKVAKLVCRDVHAYFMRNHGVVCVGADVKIALSRVAALEQACADFFQHRLQENKPNLTSAAFKMVDEALTLSSNSESIETAK